MKLSRTWLQSIISNPFRDLSEAPPSPHSRTLRTGFFGKVKDAYFVIRGRVALAHTENLPGIYDWLTLGLARASWVTFTDSLVKAKEKSGLKRVWHIFKAIVSGVFAIPLTIARTVFGIVATAVTLPVTAVVSFISFLASRKLKKQVEELELPQLGVKRTLGQNLMRDERNLDTVNITVEKLNIHESGSYSKVGLRLRFNRFDVIDLTEENFTSVKTTPAQKQSIAALLKLNVGNVLYEAEKVSPGTCKAILDTAECTKGMLRG